MAGTMKKVDKIRQIVRLKQLMTRWKQMSLRHRSSPSSPRPPSGFVFVYVGPERCRFVIPTRFLNLPVFEGLLKETEEEFGLRGNGGLVLPCQVGLFRNLVKYLHKDEQKFGKLSLDEFVNLVSEFVSDPCKENRIAFTPLLQKAEV